MNLNRSAVLLVCVAALLMVATACEGPTALSPDSSPDAVSPVSSAATTTVPAQGTATTFDVGTWNLEWFGDASNGPDDEALQLENVRDILAGVDMDVWSVQEVTSDTQFQNLFGQLSGYDGFLANSATVTDGAAYYSDFNDNELKPGLIYNTSTVSVTSAKVILTGFDYEFAGRPPVEVQLAVDVDGTTRSVVLVLLHAKAGAGQDDWDRRSAGSQALKSYLDATYPSTHVLVAGDFNDDVDVSITQPKDSPYNNFVSDTAAYTFPTQAQSDAGVTSTVFYDDMIDHQLVSDEVASTYVDGSSQVFSADSYLNDYAGTTSDHYPVLASYAMSGSSSSNTTPVASFSVSCTDLACDVDGTRSSDADGSIASYDWAFGDGTAATGSTAAYTYAAGGTYSVTLTVTDDDGATGTSTQDVTVSDAASSLTLTATGYKVKGRQTADLTWSGASSTNVDVYCDGSVIATTANDGAYTDNINQRGGGSYTYTVCEAGSSTCSADVTVTF